jgi:S-DNA-T family DNA segregation ATPase FtsK/SpoIIIE
VDFAAAWSKIGGVTKSHTGRTAEAVANVLDAVSPAFVPFAERWDTVADQRNKLRTPENLKKLMDAQRAHNAARATASAARSQRTAARQASKNPLSSARRAARTADKAARQHRDAAKVALKEARKNYPATLVTRAVQSHALHVVPSMATTWVLSTPQDWATWPLSVSAAAIGLQVGSLWLGRRTLRADVPDDLSAEERRLVERLDPSYWVQHADERGLSGTVTTPVEVTPAGLVSHVRLDGRWTPKTFRAKADEIRALLGARTDLRMEIKAGTHGDRATITLRTRSAADGIDLTGWEPGAPWGVDAVTGEQVMVPLGRRMLIAGTSGSGKSWSTRALLAEGSEAADHRLVLIDPKRVEAINWEHRARTAVRPDDVLDVTDELVAEMHERLELVPRGRDTIEVSVERPRITVFVDEGAEVISLAKDGEYRRIMENLRTLARMARAAEIILIWATQKPTMDKQGGIDPQISAQITYRAALALSTSGESRVVFGEDATERGWHAHDLPMPGVAMLRSGPKAKPHPIRTRAFSPADVIALPARPIWHRTAQAAPVAERPAGERTLRLVKDGGDFVLAPPAQEVPAVEAPATNRQKVAAAIGSGAKTAKDVGLITGINKGTVSREIKALVADGHVVRSDDGLLTLAAPAGEVSA